MRRFLKAISIAFICGILVVPPVDAQRNRRTNGSRPSTTSGSHRQSSSSAARVAPVRNSGRSGGSQSGREQGRVSGSRRPSDGVPAAAPSRNDRHATAPRQGHGNRPSAPSHGTAPGAHRDRRHGYAPHRNPRPARMAPPARPHRPPVRRYSRPLPPPSFRPYHGCPVVHGILGLTFGTAIGISVDYLCNSGYTVDGYGEDVVYLRNVSAMSLVWPDATLYYSSGGLVGSQFSYSTSYRDEMRYNRLYRTLVSQYGNPVSYSAANGSRLATWFGYDNGYISLEFGPQYSPGGHLRYYTTLTYGN